MKTRQVCKDFLRMHKGMTFDAIAAMQHMEQVWDIRVDWHEMSYALDELDHKGEAERVFVKGHDRMATYTINQGTPTWPEDFD